MTRPLTQADIDAVMLARFNVGRRMMLSGLSGLASGDTPRSDLDLEIDGTRSAMIQVVALAALS